MHDLHLVAVAGSSQEATVGQGTTFNMQWAGMAGMHSISSCLCYQQLY